MTVRPWADRVRIGTPADPHAPVTLVPPDGYIAWRLRAQARGGHRSSRRPLRYTAARLTHDRAASDTQPGPSRYGDHRGDTGRDDLGRQRPLARIPPNRIAGKILIHVDEPSPATLAHRSAATPAGGHWARAL